MKAWQKFTAIKQTNYFFDCDLFLLGFCWLFFLQFLLTKSKVKKKKKKHSFFRKKKNIFFPHTTVKQANNPWRATAVDTCYT